MATKKKKKPTPPRTPVELEDDRAFLYRLQLQRIRGDELYQRYTRHQYDRAYQREIAQGTDEHTAARIARMARVSRTTMKRDLDRVVDGLRQQQVAGAAELVAERMEMLSRDLDTTDQLLDQLWDDYRASAAGRKRTKTRAEPREKGEQPVVVMAERLEEQPTSGDPRYLAEIRATLETRAKLAEQWIQLRIMLAAPTIDAATLERARNHAEVRDVMLAELVAHEVQTRQMVAGAAAGGKALALVDAYLDRAKPVGPNAQPWSLRPKPPPKG